MRNLSNPKIIRLLLELSNEENATLESTRICKSIIRPFNYNGKH